jgi:hypothetical protein
MRTSDTDIAWLAGIVDGEGCFSVKRPIVRKTYKKGRVTSYQVWLVVCNTSEPMVRRVTEIFGSLGIGHQPVRRVWKGKKATRWQYWVHVARKHELLRLTELLLPFLVAKKDEAEIVRWFLSRACSTRQYVPTLLDRTALEAMATIKRHGGEAPAEVRELLREVIPSQAVSGIRAAHGLETEGVETRSVTPKNNPTHECPAPLHLVG